MRKNASLLNIIRRFPLPNASLFPTSTILRSWDLDLIPPIISYVGRLGASEKGIDILLEAVTILLECALPPFCLWIVGGSREQAQKLKEELLESPKLARLFAAGRLILWQRVDPSALPEIYSRSAAVVMPSRRESFGMVAIQAMACGTPVVASDVGGLQHVVLDKVSGIKFPINDAQALAWILFHLIIHRPLTRILGEESMLWARTAFQQEVIFDRLLAVYQGRELSPHVLEDPLTYQRTRQRERIREEIQRDTFIRMLGSSRNLVAETRQADGTPIAVKVFVEPMESEGSQFLIPDGLHTLGAETSRHRTLLHQDNPWVVPIVQVRTSSIHFKLAGPREHISLQQAVLQATKVGAHLTNPSEEAVRACHIALTSLLEQPDLERLGSFDRVASVLNASINGRPDIFVRCDPRAELVRDLLHLKMPFWPMAREPRRQWSGILERSLVLCESVDIQPEGCHGDAKMDHILICNGKRVMCDLEESRIVFGPLDAVSFILRDRLWVGMSSPDPEKAVEDLIGLFDSPIRCCLGVQWMVVQVLFRSVQEALWGRPQPLEKAPILLFRLIDTANSMFRS